jgi:putative transposase
LRFQWIDQQRKQFKVSIMCEVLQVSRSGFYAWMNRAPCQRQLRQEQLIEAIRQSHQESQGRYGSPRIHEDLAEQKVQVCVNTVAKLMKQAEIRSVMRRKFVVKTTDSNHDLPVAPNLLDRQFKAERPDQKWCCDITYIHTGEGFLYLAAPQHPP